MRELHSFEDHDLASRLLDVLNTSDLPAFLDEEDGKSVLWIRDDDHRMKAKEVLARFLADPNAPEFVEAEKKAIAASVEAVVREKERQRRVIDLRDRWNGVWYKTNPATMVMFYICVVVALATTDLDRLSSWKLCNDQSSKLLPLLFIQEPAVTVDLGGFQFVIPREVDLWGTVKSGQIWRFVTPIFLHFSILHILFNMSMFRDLAYAVEFVKGTRRFLLMVVTIAVVSNVAQLLKSGPNFGGMSGVVYGLIGYLWMKGKFQPEERLGLNPSQVVWSVLFLLFGLGGAIPNIANTCHVAGFLTGIVFGLRRTVIKRLKRRLQPTREESGPGE